jgi:hypothetical protein
LNWMAMTLLRQVRLLHLAQPENVRKEGTSGWRSAEIIRKKPGITYEGFKAAEAFQATLNGMFCKRSDEGECQGLSVARETEARIASGLFLSTRSKMRN